MLRSFVFQSLAVLCFSASALAQRTGLQLWYDKPAEKWEEALPVGSGRLGAMVFGGVQSERIQFNEDTLWTGKPQDYVRPGAIDGLPEVRKLIFDAARPGISKKDQETLVEQATNVFRAKMISKPVRQKAYQPFGDVRLTFPVTGEVTNYRRWLDLDTATATTTYTVNGITYTREVFASYPDNAVVIRLSADQPGKVNFAFKLDSPHPDSKAEAVDNHTLKVRGRVRDVVPNTVIRDGKIARENVPDVPPDQGMTFEARADVRTEGRATVGQRTQPDAVEVSDADAATIRLIAATSFVNWQDISGDPAARVAAYHKAIDPQPFERLKQRHLADYQPLFRRVSIDLGHNPELEKLPTDQRQKLANKVANPTGTTKKDAASPSELKDGITNDPSLVSLFFQYGRYMLITSSRPHTQAANLQGVWNELLNPPWESKYTTNINVEMNYWPAEVTNLSECHEPLFDMVDDLRISGHRTAKEMYGCDGWVLHHNTDLWRGTAPINNIDGMWTTGGAWLCHHLWEHYQFTGDKDFLARRAYPAMKEASQFFLDFLIKDPNTGHLVTNPAHSPEQGVLNAGPAMDMQLIRSLFESTTEAARDLGGIDTDFIAKIADTRKRLVPDQVGQHGQLQEWQADIDVPNNNHRHMSPLWGLYPGSQFTPANDVKTFDAAKLLLKWRGDGSTGWSYSWRIPLWARVGDGEMAYRQLALQMGKRLLPNLFDLCGPFQADGNYGSTAGVAEMLLQSHQRVGQFPEQAYVIDLLPALPKAWPNGSVDGLKARGGFEISLKWEHSKLTTGVIKSLQGNDLELRHAGRRARIETSPGQTIAVDFLDGHLNLKATP